MRRRAGRSPRRTLRCSPDQTARRVPLVVAVADLRVEPLLFLAPASPVELVISIAQVLRQDLAGVERIERRVPAHGQLDLLVDDRFLGHHRARLDLVRDAVVNTREDRREHQVRDCRRSRPADARRACLPRLTSGSAARRRGGCVPSSAQAARTRPAGSADTNSRSAQRWPWTPASPPRARRSRGEARPRTGRPCSCR